MNVWEGVYKDFNQVRKITKYNNSQNKIYILKARKIFEKNLSKFNQKKDLDHLSTERFLYLPSVIKNFVLQRQINILDFGGGFGNGYLFLKKKIDKKIFKKVNYTIIDLPEVIKEAKIINKYVNFKSSLPRKKFDIIFCCSSIQYVENWKKLIVDLTKYNSSIILLSDVFCGNIRTFATIQNYYDHKIPHWILNFNTFNKQFINNGYRLKLKKNVMASRLGKKNILQMNNFKANNRIKYTKHLIYEKF